MQLISVVKTGGAVLAAAVLLAWGPTAAFSASCSGTLTNNCVVSDLEGDFATEGSPNPAVDLRVGNPLGISETFFKLLGQTGAFTTTGDFFVNNLVNPTPASVTISVGAAGNFTAPLNLSFNGGPVTDISAGGSFFFTLLTNVVNTFSVSGTANPIFAGPINYNITLSAVPVPAALPLFGTAIGGLFWSRWRKRKGSTEMAAA